NTRHDARNAPGRRGMPGSSGGARESASLRSATRHRRRAPRAAALRDRDSVGRRRRRDPRSRPRSLSRGLARVGGAPVSGLARGRGGGCGVMSTVRIAVAGISGWKGDVAVAIFAASVIVWSWIGLSGSEDGGVGISPLDTHLGMLAEGEERTVWVTLTNRS